MTDNVLTDLLAQRVLGWGVTPDRFLTGNRSWIPRWRFSPLERLDDAFMLFDRAGVTRYAVRMDADGFHVEVEMNGNVGKAAGEPKARAITLALARSLVLEV